MEARKSKIVTTRKRGNRNVVTQGRRSIKPVHFNYQSFYNRMFLFGISYPNGRFQNGQSHGKENLVIKFLINKYIQTRQNSFASY